MPKGTRTWIRTRHGKCSGCGAERTIREYRLKDGGKVNFCGYCNKEEESVEPEEKGGESCGQIELI